jgi:hypothetical protein
VGDRRLANDPVGFADRCVPIRHRPALARNVAESRRHPGRGHKTPGPCCGQPSRGYGQDERNEQVIVVHRGTRFPGLRVQVVWNKSDCAGNRPPNLSLNLSLNLFPNAAYGRNQRRDKIRISKFEILNKFKIANSNVQKRQPNTRRSPNTRRYLTRRSAVPVSSIWYLTFGFASDFEFQRCAYHASILRLKTLLP